MTLTLPEDLVQALLRMDPDMSRAAVRLLEPAARDVVPLPVAELSRYRDSAVIVVRPTKALEAMRGVALVPLPDGRALISLEPAMSVGDLELMLRDVIDENEIDERDRSVLVSIGDMLRAARRSRTVPVRQRSIIVLQSTSRRPIRET